MNKKEKVSEESGFNDFTFHMFIQEEKMSELRKVLNSSGYEIIIIDGSRISNEKEFFLEAKKAFPLDPPLSGNVNWDAFNDSLWGGIDELKKTKIAIVWTHSDKILKKDLLMAIGVIKQVAIDVAKSEFGIEIPSKLKLFLLGKGASYECIEDYKL